MNEFAYGQQVLNEVFAQAGGNSISDIQVRSNRMVYVHTKQGLQIIYTLGELPNQVVMNVAELLYSRQESDAAQSVEARMQEQMPLHERLAEFKVVDFSCEGFPMSNGQISGRMRVQVHLSASGIGITARILSDDIAELEVLGLSQDTTRAMKNFVKRRQGLAFVTGQTGSGKSTTLAALIDWLRRSYPKHIVTVEDPIEYRYPHDMADPKDASRRVPSPGFVTQQEVGKHVKTYRQGLKDALRKAPHLILIGEIRDRETMDTAIEAAQTGHFVISTLHTNGAVKTMSRILEMFPHEQHKALLGRLAEIMCFILSQGLIPTQKGRVLNYEFLQNNDSSVRSAIAAYDGAAKSLEDAIRHSGNVAWDSNLENLLRRGMIDFEAFQMNRMNEDDADSRLFIPQRAAV